MDLISELKKETGCEVETDKIALDAHSEDAGLFIVRPKAVAYPKNTGELSKLVRYVAEHKKEDPALSLTARAAGTDMSGGPLNNSIIVDFKKYFTHIIGVGDHNATVEPGVFYRDFEKETLRYGLILPSYPASREICAMGGIVNNNSGGEKTLEYGKTADYVEGLTMVLSDGSVVQFHPLNGALLKEKMALQTLEGEIYRKMHELVTDNGELITNAKPNVTKNSAGYALWNVWKKDEDIFDLTQVITGAQGTLGLVTEATLGLVPVKKHARMLVIFLNDNSKLAGIINTVLPLKPESFEAYDDNTLKLAAKFFFSFAKQMGTKNFISLGLQFLPELKMLLTGGVPKFILQVEFAGDDAPTLEEKVKQLKEKLAPLNLQITTPKNERAAKKYWIIRRESFNLLRHRIKNKHTAPFIDDFVVRAEKLPEFLPKLNAILNKYDLLYTLAGHIGDGNFHIIPLMNLKNESERAVIPELAKKVYDLVLQYQGSITGEHNDGLVRSPYLKQMFGEEVYRLFEETKNIFDPQNIFNPGKKVGVTLEETLKYLRHN